ncbi:MAG TPA: phage holin family protein [Verrucomicrobiae bacterium]|nr:phage holin family protein [Verrucomicrobiae bacterium]
MSSVKHGFTYRLLLRWFVCSLGLWIAAGLLSGSVSYHGNHLATVIIAGLILAILNAIIKPLLVLISLPAILLTLGLFMLVINGATVYLVSKLYSGLQISSFGVAILTGVIIGLVNYLVTAILEER